MGGIGGGVNTNIDKVWLLKMDFLLNE